MAINILDRETEELAREVAAKTGESLADAVRHSLEERLTKLADRPALSEDLYEKLMAISRRCSALPDLDRREPDEILGYDPYGAFR